MNKKGLLAGLIFKDEPATEQKEQAPAQQAAAPTSTPKIASQGTIQGVADNKFIQMLEEVIAQNNIPGQDYFEFKQAIENMGSIVMDDKTKFLTVYNVLSLQGCNKDVLLSSLAIIESNISDIEKSKQIDNLIATYRTNPLVDAADAFAKAFNTDFQFAYNGIKNARLTTLGDNRDFFGLNSLYQGITGEQLYSKMSIVYGQIGLAKNPVAWRNISNTSIVEAMNITTNQESEGSVKFTAATQEIKQKEAMSNKTITINFDNNSSTLSDDAMATIDREFVNIAKTFTKARIRIEGNTDAVGNASYNKSLSQKRAQAVANYLIKEYGFDPNRFIVVGNGMNKAIADGVSGSNEFYRRTDFQLIED